MITLLNVMYCFSVMRSYDDYPTQQETVLDTRQAFRSPQEVYYKRTHRPRRYSAGADATRHMYRTFSDDQKMLIHSGVQAVPAEVYPCPEPRCDYNKKQYNSVVLRY